MNNKEGKEVNSKEIDSKEIDTSVIRTLERITVTGIQQSDTINVIVYSNEYYCIDDPILLKDKDKVKIRVVARVEEEEDLYREYVRNNIRNPLNPFAIMLLYLKGNKLVQVLPEEIIEILEKNKDIHIAVIEKLNQQLLRLNKPIVSIDIKVLETINKIIKKAEQYNIEKEKLVDKLIEYIEIWITAEKGELYSYPDPVVLANVWDLLLEDIKKEEKGKEKEEEEEEIKGGEGKEKGLDITTTITDQKRVFTITNKKEPIPIYAGTNNTNSSNSSNSNYNSINYNSDLSNQYSSNSNTEIEEEEEKEKQIEEKIEEIRMIERTIAFKIIYREDRSSFIDRLIENVIRRVVRIFAKAGVTVQTT